MLWLATGQYGKYVRPVPEPVITVTLVIFQSHIKERWWGLFLADFSLARSEWGAGKEFMLPSKPRGHEGSMNKTTS
jgi:hypothetical protein